MVGNVSEPNFTFGIFSDYSLTSVIHFLMFEKDHKNILLYVRIT